MSGRAALNRKLQQNPPYMQRIGEDGATPSSQRNRPIPNYYPNAGIYKTKPLPNSLPLNSRRRTKV